MLLIAQVAGCASFEGMPKPVVPLTTALRIATSGTYSAEEALKVADGTTSVADQKSYRNAFIAIHLQAADARYGQFRTDLSQQMKGANFGMELGILALTGVGAIAASERAANILSAAASGLTGSKAALSKEVYFEKTLPALIASMDARRLTAKTAILDKMRNRTALDYTIQEAMIDLSAYQMIASLDGAIEQVTTAAAADKAEAQARYDAVIHACKAEKGVGDVWGVITDGLDTMTPADKADLDQISQIVGAPTSSVFDDQREAITDVMIQTYCSVDSANTLLATLKAKTKVQFQ